jgi:subtilisin family serine protease
MTQPNDSFDAKFLSQWEAVRAAVLEDGTDVEWSVDRADDGTTPAYLYEKNRIIVRDVDRDLVIGRNIDADPVPERGVVPDDGSDGVGLYQIGENVVDAVNRLNGLGLRPERVATPNHLMSICPTQMCPADEPVPLPIGASQEPYPPRTTGTGGEGVQVDVLDTGLVPGFDAKHEWLAGIQEFDDGATFGPTGAIAEYGGHGTFVTGVLRCAAPATAVRSTRIFRYAGATFEDQLGDALLAALRNNPHIISLSAGSTTMGDLPHVGLEPFYMALTQPDIRTLLVAAAGNDGTTRRFYPAAYANETDAVVSVGALRYDGEGRACFSNYGDWVDVFALGERHINAFTSGSYSYVDPPQFDLTCRFYRPRRLYSPCTCVTMPPQGAVVEFSGMARWSGTSFATPLVAGLIATHMSTTGEMNPRIAAEHVLSTAVTITDSDEVKLSAIG